MSARGAFMNKRALFLLVTGIGRAGGPDCLVNPGGVVENASSVFTTNSLGIGRAGGPGCLVSVGGEDGVGVSKNDVNLVIYWAGPWGSAGHRVCREYRQYLRKSTSIQQR